MSRFVCICSIDLNQVLRPSIRKYSIQQGSVQAFDKAVVLRTANLRGAVLESFELQEQLIRMPIRALSLCVWASILRQTASTAIHLLDEDAEFFFDQYAVVVKDVISDNGYSNVEYFSLF